MPLINQSIQNVSVMLINDNWPSAPMRWYIKITRRLVYLAPVDEDKLNYKQLIAPLPPHPIDKCKMDISILVMLTVEKFLYHMPVWRQQQRLRIMALIFPIAHYDRLLIAPARYWNRYGTCY
jgi:hypothetical protein